MKYTEAKALFETCRNEYSGKPLRGRCGSTRLFKRDNLYSVRFHNTHVVQIDETDACILKNGGYYTPSTKERIEEYAPVYLTSANGAWYLKPSTDPTWPGKRLWLFVDGMHVDANGIPFERQPVGIKLQSYTEKQWKDHVRLERNRLARDRRVERKEQAKREAERKERNRMEDIERQKRKETAEAERIERERLEDIASEAAWKREAGAAERLGLKPKATVENGIKRTRDEMRTLLKGVSGGLPRGPISDGVDYRIGALGPAGQKNSGDLE